MEKYKFLEPIRIRRTVLKNRIVMSALSTNYANRDGSVSDKLMQHYVERARGGVGMIVVEASGVSAPEGLIDHNQLSIKDPAALTGFKNMTEAMHVFDCKVLIQLHHGGLKANPDCCEGMQSIAASESTGIEARSATTTEVQRIEKEFIQAAVNAYKAGFDGVELHAAHSYFIDSFLSPHINRRTDIYGGSSENRFRLLRNILQGIRKECPPAFLISVRLAPSDEFVDGLDIEEGIQYAKWCEEYGADMLNISAGFGDGSTGTQWDTTGKFLNRTEMIKKHVGIPVFCVGKFRDPEEMSKILVEKKVDMVAVGRQFLCDPYWPEKVMLGRENEIRSCLSCNDGCIHQYIQGGEVRCVLNPYVGFDHKENEHTLVPSGELKKVAVVGGGIGGIQAAITLKKRGHDVAIYEKTNRLGGQMRLAALPPKKEPLKKGMQWFIDEIGRLQIPVCLETEATAELLEKEGYSAAILACGSEPNRPPIEGLELAQDYKTAMEDPDALPRNEKVVVIGGGQVGCELAHLLVEQDCDVTVVEMLDEILNGTEPGHRKFLNDYLIAKAKVITKAAVARIDKDGIAYKDSCGIEHKIAADSVIYSIGQHPLGEELYRELMSRGIRAYKVGESRQTPGNLRLATRNAQDVALAI